MRAWLGGEGGQGGPVFSLCMEMARTNKELTYSVYGGKVVHPVHPLHPARGGANASRAGWFPAAGGNPNEVIRKSIRYRILRASSRGSQRCRWLIDYRTVMLIFSAGKCPAVAGLARNAAGENSGGSPGRRSGKRGGEAPGGGSSGCRPAMPSAGLSGRCPAMPSAGLSVALHLAVAVAALADREASDAGGSPGGGLSGRCPAMPSAGLSVALHLAVAVAALADREASDAGGSPAAD